MQLKQFFKQPSLEEDPKPTHNTGSMNSIKYNYASLAKQINAIITESKQRSGTKKNEIKMPITRESMK